MFTRKIQEHFTAERLFKIQVLWSTYRSLNPELNFGPSWVSRDCPHIRKAKSGPIPSKQTQHSLQAAMMISSLTPRTRHGALLDYGSRDALQFQTRTTCCKQR